MRKLIPSTMLILMSLPGLTSCSVADMLSSNEIIEELDEIVKIEHTGDVDRIVYMEQAKVSKWYMHNSLLGPIRTPLGWTFGRRAVITLENPGQHVRDLLAALPDQTNANIVMCGAAASRFCWLAILDLNPETQVLAVDGLADVCRQLDINPFEGDFNESLIPLDAGKEETARAGLRLFAPPENGRRRADEDLTSYQIALEQISSGPLGRTDEMFRLIDDLSALYAVEPAKEPRKWIAEALKKAISYSTYAVLLGTIKSRSRRLAELRLCAMEQIRRLGGARTVPLLLAIMTASPQELAAGLSSFTRDSLVQLRLIHYCGQLKGELANTMVRLPGREQWASPTPNQFLARTILNERAYYSKVRTPAIVALTWSLGRPRVDPDPAWVRKWLEENS
jgi:hypothetical protein